MVEKDRCIRARIQRKQQLPRPEAGQMNRDDEQRGQGYCVWCLRWCHQRDVPSFHGCLHHLCVVDAKHAVRVVHQHVEMPQKIPYDNDSKVEICCLQRLEVLNFDEMVRNRVRAGFQQVQIRK